ncbi:trehalose-phosphatase [Dermatobacter hominis]|uniref:trehalose-phosphatase n=1 Tax=Dermatobacter hominis TaxID=2884263 RepID=UPI001D12EC22|nr:trehalose-phosphatase [Dermatobacter hominis]UDY34575.1 trehalose-phosphatase [Dermatobacter hominis]
MGVPDALEPFRTHAADALVAFDFDGTLAPIVDDPEAAAPMDGVAAALERLAARFGEVAVISGRPLAFLERWFPEPSGVTLVGLYGLEARRLGERADHPTSGVWRETMADVAGLARMKGPEGMDIELKGLSITLHYRRRPELEGEVIAWAEQIAGPTGLRARPAKMSVELHPPIDEDKGTVLQRLAGSHTGPVLFAGDDLGDVPAFQVLDELRAAGRGVLAVVVDGPEVPGALRDRADLLVDGPAAVADLVLALGT